jgi:hypothetical protein
MWVSHRRGCAHLGSTYHRRASSKDLTEEVACSNPPIQRYFSVSFPLVGRLSLFDVLFPAGTIREQLGTIREQISCNVRVNHRLNRRNGRLFLPDSGTNFSLPGSPLCPRISFHKGFK